MKAKFRNFKTMEVLFEVDNFSIPFPISSIRYNGVTYSIYGTAHVDLDEYCFYVFVR